MSSSSFDANSVPAIDSSKIWTTLLTNRGYLAGLLVLDHTIKKHGSRYQLVVMLSGAAADDPEMRATLEAAGIPVKIVEQIEPAPQNGRVNKGTWEKLAPWSFTEYERITLLDSDQIALHNFDELMTVDMPAGWIAASHACTCNPRKLAHYPKDWVPENCGFTAADKTTGAPQPLSSDSPRNHLLLNSGTVVLTPSQEDYDQIIHTMNTHPAVPDMIFYDQDLLPIVYDEKWLPLPYIYNGLKTLRGCHSDLWKDNDVKILHYILQKPWKTRTIDQDIVGIQHQLWWDEYNQLESKWKSANNKTRNLLWKNIVEPQVAPKLSPLASLSSALPSNILAGKQLPATLQIPASYRTTEGVLLSILLAAILGYFIGRGTKPARSSVRRS